MEIKKSRMNHTVTFEILDHDKMGMAIAEHEIAKFPTQSEACFFAKEAYTAFPSPHPKHTRRYIVYKGKTRVYVAG